MRQVIEYAAYNPQLPVFLGILLYIWIAAGSWLIKKPDFAGMWFCYAGANGFMFWHYIRTM